MVEIAIIKDRSGRNCGFRCSGHAEYSEKGFDIVCSGISALTNTTVLALEQLVKLSLQIEADPDTAFLECRWSNAEAVQQTQADLLLKTMYLGLREIQKQYPKNLSLRELEV